MGINGYYKLVTSIGNNFSSWTDLYVKFYKKRPDVPQYWLQTTGGRPWKIAKFSTKKYDANSLRNLRNMFDKNETGFSVGVVARSPPGARPSSNCCEYIPYVDNDALRQSEGWQMKIHTKGGIKRNATC